MFKNAFIHKLMNWYFVLKIVLTYCMNKLQDSVIEKTFCKILGREFAKCLRSLKTVAFIAGKKNPAIQTLYIRFSI